MGDFRVRYGFALGKQGATAYVSGAFLFPADDTTPDVTDGTLFLTNNATATTISYFDVRAPGGLVSLDHQGKRITIIANDNLTTLARAGQLHVSGTGATLTTGQTVTFVYYNSAWYEESSSDLGRETVKTVTVAGAALAPNVAGAQVLIVNNTAASTVLGLSGGVIGQMLYVGQAAAAVGTALTIQGAANLWLAGTGAFVANVSAFYQFVCDNGTRFRQVGPAALP